jgi:hypothetical protein
LATREIEELRNYQRNNLDAEVNTLRDKTDNIRNIFELLKQEVFIFYYIGKRK